MNLPLGVKIFIGLAPGDNLGVGQPLDEIFLKETPFPVLRVMFCIFGI